LGANGGGAVANDADAKLLALEAEHAAAWAALERANALLIAAETSLNVAGIVAAAKLQSEAMDHLRKLEKRIRRTPARAPHGLAIKARLTTMHADCDRSWKGHLLARAVLVLAGTAVQ
jgi:hypothetical protein